jgi:hypothetical protein
VAATATFLAKEEPHMNGPRLIVEQLATGKFLGGLRFGKDRKHHPIWTFWRAYVFDDEGLLRQAMSHVPPEDLPAVVHRLPFRIEGAPDAPAPTLVV